jgi:radical SAM protein with 4Fe4S-binding SPASM domain
LKLQIYPLRKDNTVYGCEASKTLMAIEPNGKVKACGILPECFEMQIKEKTLLEIWHSPQFIEIRRQLTCSDCNYTQI